MTLTPEILTAFGPGDAPRPNTPLWAIFDPGWYRERYRQAVIEMTGSLPDDRGLYEFWLRDGARYAHSPNRYFDEIWYRRAHFDVENGIRMGVFDSGFQHYCETGHRGRSCHWMFSESNYFALNTDLTPSRVRELGYANGYDHYLAVGQVERRVSTAFLVPDMLRAELLQHRLPYDPQIGEFSRFVLNADCAAMRTSWYFDPEWYLDRYRDVAPQIASGVYDSPLHHYLSNENPAAYNPNAFFDEAYYLATYEDVGGQVTARVLRNGYDHFVRFGLFEGRSPAEGVELPPTVYDGDVPGWAAICDNPFIAHIRRDGALETKEPVDSPSLRQLDTLQALRTESLIPLLARYPLDFRYVGQPALGVVIATPELFTDLIQTLVSLHDANKGDMQIVLLTGAHKDDTASIARYAYGIESVEATGLSVQEGLQRAVAQVAAPRVLVVQSGVTLFSGALEAAKACLEGPGVVAVAPQSLGFDLTVVEAGLCVARDGSCTSYGAGEEAFAAGLDFVRACDGCSRGALLCDTDALRAVTVPDEAGALLRVEAHIWASLALALRQSSDDGRVLYAPDFVIRVPERECAQDGLIMREQRILRQVFAQTLRGNPPGRGGQGGAMYRPARWGRRVLLLASQDVSLPVAQDMRLHALARSMVGLGLQVTQFVLDEGRPGDTGRDAADANLYDRARSCRNLSGEVESRSGTLDALARFIEQRRRGFDQIWVMGGRTLNRVIELFSEKAECLPDEGFILDLRILESLERDWENVSSDQMPRPVETPAIRQALLDETANAWFCQDIVVQNAQQAERLEEADLRGLTILGDDLPAHEGEDFDRRHDLVFAVPSQKDGYDLSFLKWFARSVLVRLDGHLPETARLILAYEGAPTRDLMMIVHYAHVASLDEGKVPLSELAARCRLMIAPEERDGNVSLQRLVAGASGLPAVIGGDVSSPGAMCTSSSAARFAEAIITLYQDRETWQRLSDEAKEQAGAMTGRYRETLAGLLGQSLVKEEFCD